MLSVELKKFLITCRIVTQAKCSRIELPVSTWKPNQDDAYDVLVGRRSRWFFHTGTHSKNTRFHDHSLHHSVRLINRCWGTEGTNHSIASKINFAFDVNFRYIGLVRAPKLPEKNKGPSRAHQAKMQRCYQPMSPMDDFNNHCWQNLSTAVRRLQFSPSIMFSTTD